MKIKFLFAYLALITNIYAVHHAQDIEAVFTNIFSSHLWQGIETVSGGGSDLNQTVTIRNKIPELLKSLDIKVLLDAPCGDFFWMKEVNLDFLDLYIGCDIVKELIAQTQDKYGTNKRLFFNKNLISDDLPRADLIFCRDCLVHLSFKDIFATLRNFKKSKARYLLTTHFTKKRNNVDIKAGKWRTLNFELPPFNFPKPSLIINENCPEKGYSDKSLALWRIVDLPI